MITCYIAIGSNLGDREKNIASAIEELKNAKGTEFRRASSIYETEPVSDIPQGKFLNGILEIETTLGPHDLLGELQQIEARLGRTRTARGGPRTMDLDILYYGEEKINYPGLIVPHPRISQREFVLRGLRELGKAL